MEGLIPIIMAVAWMTLLASSILSSLVYHHLNCLKTLIVYPFFSKVIHPSSISFSRVETQLLIVSKASLSSRNYLLLSDLILYSHKHVRLFRSKTNLSSQSPVVLYHSPLLSMSLAIPLKLSQGPGHGSRHRLVATI